VITWAAKEQRRSAIASLNRTCGDDGATWPHSTALVGDDLQPQHHRHWCRLLQPHLQQASYTGPRSGAAKGFGKSSFTVTFVPLGGQGPGCLSERVIATEAFRADA